jgi:N-acetylmuramoyl-L-alanine amidase
LGFISNPGDLKVLTSVDGRNDIADKLMAAFTSFKTSYDSSLNVQSTPTSAPAQTSVSVQSQDPAPEKKEDTVRTEPVQVMQKTDGDVYYGVQIMGLGRLLKNGDPALKGLEIQAVKTPESNIYKYVTGKYSDREGAAQILPSVKKKFPEAFLVKVEGNTVNRLR